MLAFGVFFYRLSQLVYSITDNIVDIMYVLSESVLLLVHYLLWKILAGNLFVQIL